MTYLRFLIGNWGHCHHLGIFGCIQLKAGALKDTLSDARVKRFVMLTGPY